MMKRVRLRFLAVAALCVWLPAAALALTGQSITTFETYYSEDLAYINENTGRHMLPIELGTQPLDDTGRMQYFSYSDALHVTIAADPAGVIESCEIRLLLPEGAAEGNSLYLSFVAANYHCLALLMAMHVSTDAAGRYLLAEEIGKGLEDNHGAYERRFGSYDISSVKVVGEGAVFTFTNSGLTPAATEPPAEGGEPTPVPQEDTDEDAYVG